MDKILVVDNITKEYPGRTAVSQVSFEVMKGSVHGFLGPNGAGKSTTMKMIAGLLPPTSGKITFMGENLTTESHSLKNKLGLLPENPPLYFDMTVEKYLGFVAKLHGVTNVKSNVEKVLTSLSLTDVSKRLIGNLSKGYKQRVGLAQALVYDAPFIILDEPSNGLDPEAVVELRVIIRKLALEKTVLFSSHILSEVEQVCDHITIIHQGKIRASGDIQEIHRKFRQGFVVKIGMAPGDVLPDLNSIGKYEITHRHSLGHEDQYHVCFENERDCRAELGKMLVSSGVRLLTLQAESPELEELFLHMTEKKK
ncbi:MAG TPA: ABC transporter ATP-binding protein [Bacteriovoracaceae bacterium]|nr:ABC transporter ATP-binding protein [Bacteriovoracaceae bacterium]